MDVAAWLQRLGLERYVPAFRDNEIDWDALPKLTAEDLKDLGVMLGGHRRRLLDAIAALGTASAARTAASRDAPAPADAERRQLNGNVLRPGRLDRARGPPRSRGFARGHRRVSSHRHGSRRRVRWFRREVYGRRGIDLF